MDEFSIRFASANDYDKIIELSKGIYCGHDFLPDSFHDWLKHKSRLIFVGLQGEEIVGLVVSYVIDDEKTIVYQAQRIHKDFKGMGIAAKLISQVTEYLLNKYPSVLRLRNTLGMGKLGDMEQVQKIYEWTGASLILQMGLLSCYVTDNVHLGEMIRDNTVQLYNSKKADIPKYLFYKVFTRDLFEKNIHVTDWKPYELVESNLNLIFNDDDYMLIDVDMSKEVMVSLKSFSHGCISNRGGGKEWHVTIYANDVRLFRAHVLYQIKNAVQVMKGENPLMVFILKPKMVGHGLRLFCDDLRFQLYNWSNINALALYERKLSHHQPLSKY